MVYNFIIIANQESFMKISALLEKDKLSLSFEVFPPKTTSAFLGVKEATEEIARLYTRPKSKSVIDSLFFFSGWQGSISGRLPN